MRKLILLSLLLLALVIPALQPPLSAQPSTPLPATNPIKSIDLPQMPVELPDGPGKAQTMASCIICHSPRYITMQPFFPRKTWEAQVDKMRKVYGAPITDAAVPDIVNYLVSVRGKADPVTRPAK